MIDKENLEALKLVYNELNKYEEETIFLRGHNHEWFESILSKLEIILDDLPERQDDYLLNQCQKCQGVEFICKKCHTIQFIPKEKLKEKYEKILCQKIWESGLRCANCKHYFCNEFDGDQCNEFDFPKLISFNCDKFELNKKEE